MAVKKKAKKKVGRAMKARPRPKTRAKAKPKAKPRPSTIAPGFHVLTPSFRVPDCGMAVEFLQKAFGAKVKDRYDGPDGKVAHCELRLGDSIVMCGDVPAEQAFRLSAMIYVKDCDSVFEKALSAGATSIEPPSDQFYGDRNARLKDPFGNEWIVATHKETLSKREIVKRMQSMMAGG